MDPGISNPCFSSVHCIYYTLESYSAMRRKDILPFLVFWMDLEHIMEIWDPSDKETHILYNITYVWNLKMPDS